MCIAVLDTEVAECFNVCFRQSERTVMVGGATEPLYLPAGEERTAELHYREDFAASALHEAAHWCIAGNARRARLDFGYDYQPPPRSEPAQAAFFALEIKAQALECLFAQAAGVEFSASADNLNADVKQFEILLKRSTENVRDWLAHTQDSRARRYLQALAQQGLVYAGEADGSR
jgi:elongation factor P hydroxylase